MAKHIGGMPGMSVDHGTVVGRQGAGLNSGAGLTPGDPMMHSFGNYGKGASMGDLLGPMGMGGAMPMMGGRHPDVVSGRRLTLKGRI